MKGNTWVDTVELIAETDRILRQKHEYWSSKMTAERLSLSPSVVSVCVRLDAAFARYPALRHYTSRRRAYEELRMIRKREREATQHPAGVQTDSARE